jgi:hypothetical protein
MLTTKTPANLPFADDHANYLYQRAEEELDLAQAADHPAAVKAHYTMADRYLDSAYGVANEAAEAA